MLEPTIESRLAELELKLLGAQSVVSASDNGKDISTRLDKILMRSSATSSSTAEVVARGKQSSAPPSSSSSSNMNAQALLSNQRSELHEDYRVIHRILSELDISPTLGPTTTATASAGDSNNGNSFALISRRMEILASCETMKRDMDLLAQIRDLTSIGTKTDSSLSTTSSSAAAAVAVSSTTSRVVNCPIVSSERYNLASNPEAIQQLDTLCIRVKTLIERCAMASQRADGMLNSYGKIMMALSEKMVLAEEQMQSLQRVGGTKMQ